MANNQMENCPVCGTEYSYVTINVCQTCGWDLTPYPGVLGEIPTSVLQREQTKLTWARGMWAQLQLQSKIMSFEAQQQLAEKERSHIQTQLEELFSQLKETRQLLTSAASSPTTAQVAETQEQLQQLQKEQDLLQAQLALSQAQIRKLNEQLEEANRKSLKKKRYSCPNCGASLTDPDDTFCWDCGYQLRNEQLEEANRKIGAGESDCDDLELLRRELEKM